MKPALFVGLGNPGKKYQKTRHNIGQFIIEKYVAASHQSSFRSQKSLQANIFQKDHLIFATPTVFMNESGISVSALANYYKILPARLYVIHDDLDIGVGEYRLQFNRGPAGHHGVESIIQHLGTQQFHRLRLGIGHPSSPVPVENYVLQPLLAPTSTNLENTLNKTTLDQFADKIIRQIDQIISGL